VAAALGSAAFLLLAPGVMAGLTPWLITGWDPAGAPLPLQVAGWLLIAAGLAALLHSFARFVLEGRGTPAPVAPTEQLVVGGLYRYVRNPMYVAVAAIIVGQALVLGRPGLLLYALGFILLTSAFARFYEEPVLRDRYGAQFEEYRRAVPAWLPRRRAFRR
jgi:protein-S-isoprenylcysteine O-methyltransferase Ste14